MYQAIEFQQEPLKDTKYGSASVGKYRFLTIDRPGCYPEPDIAGIEKEAQELTKWFQKVGFPLTYGNKYEKYGMTGASHAALLLPNRKCDGDRHVRAFGSMIMWFFVVDDIFDFWQVEDKDFFLNLDIRLFTQIFEAMSVILSGNYKEYLKYDNGHIPHYQPLCKALIDVNELMAQGDDKWEEHSIYFARYMKEYLISNFWRYGKVNRDECSEITYLYFRGHYSGLFFCYEMLGLANGGFISQEMRDNIDFVRYLNAAVWAGAVANDVLGVGKEIEDNETESLVIHKVLNQHVTLEQAFRESVNLTNQEMKEAIFHSERLLKAYPEDENLKKYIQGANWALQGHLRWYAYSKRYGEIDTKIFYLTEEEMMKLLTSM